MNPFINYHVILVCLLIGFCGESFSIQPSQPVKASWISDVESIVPGESFVVGIVLTHPPHWHTYWVNPGTGYRTRITWTLPEGFSVTDIAWPTPKSFTLFGEPLFGYEGEVVFPFTVTPPDTIKPGTKVALQAKAEFLQCDDKICIPGQGDLSLILPVDRGHRPTPEAVQSRIRSSLDSLPKPMAFGVNARLVDNAFHMVFSVPLSGVGEARFFPSQVGVYDLSGFTPSRPFEGGVRFILPLTHGLESVPGRIQGVLAIQQPGKPYHGYAIDVVVGGGDPPSSNVLLPTSPSMVGLLWGGLIGGLILNFMPCVFPVISLKILGFVSLAGSDPRKVWLHGIAFFCGILISFWIVGVTLLAVQAVAPSIGWGFQLREPGFVVFMSLLFLLLSLNLFGVFEIGTSLGAMSASLTRQRGMSSSFFTGVLATMVATPCTAPFMGPAIGVALTQSGGVAMVLFTSVGVGMGLPYLLLSRFPQWLNILPKPGPWMETFKKMMGFPLLGFCLFLVYLFADLQGSGGLARLMAGLLFCGLAAYVYGHWGSLSSPLRTRCIATLVAVVLIAGSGIYATRSPQQIHWELYDQARIRQLEEDGKPYFIDFTATWCLTCLANKKWILNTRAVQQLFKEKGVALIQADWTLQEEPITSALAAYGRSSVPLYVLYDGRGESVPRALPEPLTKGVVVEALEGM